jgi:hypothetical protein
MTLSMANGDWHLMRMLRILILATLVLPSVVSCGDGRGIDAPISLSGRVKEEVSTEPVQLAPTDASSGLAVESASEPATVPPASPTDAPSVEGLTAEPPDETVPSANTPPGIEPQQDIEAYTFDPGLWELSIAALSSFRQKAVLDFTVDGSGDHSRVTYEGEVTTSPLALHSLLRVEGRVAAHLPSNKIEAIWIGEQVWVKVGRRPWVQVSAASIESEFEGQVMGVGDLLPFVQRAQRVMPDETVNGMPCKHYVYDVSHLKTESGMASAKGDIWVAKEDGQVVRLTMDGQGVYYEIYPSSGTLALVYDLFDVNMPISIKPPR